MVRRVPALVGLVPLKHGEIRHPYEAEIFARVAGFRKDAVPVSVFLRQCQTQQTRRRVDSQLLRRNFAVRGQCRLWSSLGGAGH